KCQRFIVAEQCENCIEDDKAVSEESYFRVAALRTGRQSSRNLDDPKSASDCLNRQFRFDFESAAKHGKRLNEPSIERAIARQNVGQPDSKHLVQQGEHKSIAPSVEMLELTLA